MAVAIEAKPDPLPTAAPRRMAFSWRPGFAHKVPAEAAFREIERIKRESGQESVRPGDVVDASRHPDAPLHPEFEWDDAVAAEEHRKHQARNIINSVRIVGPEEDNTEEDAQSPRIAFVSTILPDLGRCYVATDRAMQDKALREQAIRDAIKLLCGVQSRFGHLQELAAVGREIDRLKALSR